MSNNVKFGAKFSHNSPNSLFSGSINLAIKWRKCAMSFLNRALILIIKFNNLQEFFVCNTIHN